MVVVTLLSSHSPGSHKFGVAFMNMKPPFSHPSPASSSGSTPASPRSSPLLGEPWLGQYRWKGPPSVGHGFDSLWRALHGSARLSQQPLSDAQPSPSLQKLWCRQYAHAQTHTLMNSAYQVGPWEPPTSQLARPQQLERLKPPYVSKRKSSRRMEGGRDGRVREKKRRGISISSCSTGCLPHHQFPLRMSLGRLGRERMGVECRGISEEGCEWCGYHFRL